MRIIKLTEISTFNREPDRVTKVNPTGFSTEKPENTDSHPANTRGDAAIIDKATALVPLEPSQPSRIACWHNSRQSAPLIAHLIATHLELPQTRMRRRASFKSASNAYDSGRPNRVKDTLGTRCIKLS
ncbi:MAG: hypothetical protein K8F25_09995 [Fimbriimonadaceae bacterium]|nr:hypothetical protein [Alphaproteobacteria bacterium]